MNRCKSAVAVLAFAYMLGGEQVFADSNSDVKNLEGFYVGADIVYNHASVKNDEAEGIATLFASGRQRDLEVLGEIKNRRCHVDPSINIGYSHFVNNWYVGLGGDASFCKNNKNFVIADPVYNEGYETKISGISYGIKAKGGYYFSQLNSVIYGIAGVRWREISYRRYLDGEFASKAKLKSPSFLLGLGLERSLCQKLSLSAEYEYSWRNSTNSSVDADGVMSFVYNVKQRLREHTLKIGVKYHI